MKCRGGTPATPGAAFRIGCDLNATVVKGGEKGRERRGWKRCWERVNMYGSIGVIAIR